MTMLGKRERTLAIIVAFCLGILIFDNLILKPLSNLWKKDKARIVELQQELSRAQSLADNAKKWQLQLRETRQKALPAEPSQAENALIKLISESAAGTSIQVSSMRPAWRDSSTKENPGTRILELHISARGRNSDLAHFLYKLETAPGPITPGKARWTPRDNHGKSIDLDLTICALTAANNKTVKRK